jgi:hypothetical protein
MLLSVAPRGSVAALARMMYTMKLAAIPATPKRKFGRGLEAIEKGEAIGAKTERERAWLAALKAFYKDYDTVDQDTRTKNYEKAMEALAKKYPDDVEAKIFWALALNETFDHKSMAPLVKAIQPEFPIWTDCRPHGGVHRADRPVGQHVYPSRHGEVTHSANPRTCTAQSARI